MTTDFETELRETLHQAVAGTTVSDDWEAIRRRVADDAPRRVDPTRSRILAIAASVIVVAGMAGLAVSQRGSSVETENTTADADPIPPTPLEPMPDTTLLVRDGETVLSLDPLVVVGAEHRRPDFDVAAFGEQVVMEPIGLDDPDVASLIDDRLVGETWKLTLIGRVDGRPLVAQLAPGNDDSRPTRKRTVVWPSGETSARWNSYDPEQTEADRAFELTRRPVADVGVGLTVWDGLPSRAALVTFVDGSQQLWQYPRDGVAAFPTQLGPDERYLITVYDADGNELHRLNGLLAAQSEADLDLTIEQPVGPGNPEAMVTLSDAVFGGVRHEFAIFPNTQGPAAPCIGLSRSDASESTTTMACPTEPSEVAEFAAAIEVGNGNFIVGYGLRPAETITARGARQTLVTEDADGNSYFVIELSAPPGAEPIELLVSDPSGETRSILTAGDG